MLYPTLFDQPLINRVNLVRENKDLLYSKIRDKNSLFLISHMGQFLCVDDKLSFISFDQLSGWMIEEELEVLSSDPQKLSIYLGEWIDGEVTRHLFCINISDVSQLQKPVNLFKDARTAAFAASSIELESIIYAKGLLNWHHSHQFCSKCGSTSQPTGAGHTRQCINQSCLKQHFPKIEPAVIFSIETIQDGTPKLLLARQANWPENRYSVIAGFAEHGESLEHAVIREAKEEVGLKVSKIKYVASQPWPFPASLMLAFQCETKDTEIRLVDQELEKASWFSADEIESQLQNSTMLMPFSISISWALIDQWFKRQKGYSLEDVRAQ